MPDLDVHLVSPAGNDNGLFTDIGSNTQQAMNLTLDDEAGVPIGLYTVVSGMTYAPELAYRLGWFDGEDAGGTWTLVIRDDATGDGGNLTNWSITICEPPPPPMCPAGSQPFVVYSSDFEANDGGFTHSGTADEWEWGLPSSPPLASCNSGSGCWKTDLDNTYDLSSNQDLLSPNINLAGFTDAAWVTWSRQYQMESASFDHAYFDVQQAGGSAPRRLWEWMDATMTNSVGNPPTVIQESAGWGTFSQDISDYLGQNIELRFHLDSDTSLNMRGLAVDDVSVTACEVLPTNTPTATATATASPTITQTPTNTATPTATAQATDTATATATAIATAVATETATSEAPTPTATATGDPGPTNVDVTQFRGDNNGSGFVPMALVVLGVLIAAFGYVQSRRFGRTAK
jgi:hypothetical protein